MSEVNLAGRVKPPKCWKVRSRGQVEDLEAVIEAVSQSLQQSPGGESLQLGTESTMERSAASMSSRPFCVSISGTIKGGDGHSIDMGIDTSSFVSLISRSLWTAVGSPLLIKTVCTKKLQYTTGESMSVYGRAWVPLEVQGIGYPFPMYIIDELDADVVLGMDFLKGYQGRLNFTHMLVSLGGFAPIPMFESGNANVRL